MQDHGFFDSDGIWVSENPQRFKHFLQKHANKRAVLKVKKWYRQRTKKENSYTHWMFTFIGNELGYSMPEVKGYYKLHFGIKHTSELTTVECEAFLEDVRRHCLQFHGIMVPLPNEVIYD
jgi:hypothetical protein